MTTGEGAMREILLVEDNPADVYLVREALREYGMDCAIRIASSRGRSCQSTTASSTASSMPRRST